MKWMFLVLAPGLIPLHAAEPTREQTQFFETKVRPLLAKRCFRCHGPKRQRGKLRLDARANLLKGGDSGRAIEPGHPEKSLLIQAVNYGKLKMPPDARLPKNEIQILTTWVKMGAPWPGDSKARPVVEGKPFQITEKDRSFWSFLPIVRPKIPPSDRDCETAIDAFVHRKLKSTGLALSPPAQRRELIRRLYFDLLGLPPTPEEVDAFVSDSSPDAYPRLVDRLLASPRYGERWGRHWLDLVRYAQSNGYERDDEKPEAWRYRDYVIRSFNEDKPYDRFILEQLAGDEIKDVTSDSIIATGYYRLGVWDDEPDDKVLAKWDEIDDVMRTTGETFLGLTLGCARCHDHKFDPIPQKDYYRLASFFRNVSPYGKDKSATHWQLNPNAIFTPLSSGRVLSVRESGTKPPPTRILIRGSPLTPGDEVKPGFLQVLTDIIPTITPPAAPPNSLRGQLLKKGVKQTSGRRLALAKWLVGSDNPLTARVMANRLWHYHFGRGLVETPNDFGRTGQKPSHPELLDWLASELRNKGWRLKPLHRQILLTRTYRQSSRASNAKAKKLDPRNRLLWRQNMRRLDAEQIRDSILAVNGRLNLKMGGRGIFPLLPREVLATQSKPGNGWGKSSDEERARRSVHIFIKRTLTVPFMESFDQPTPDKPTPARATTTIAPQALILLNSQFMMRNATALAERIAREVGDDEGKQIDRAFRLALSRRPNSQERQILLQFLARQRVELRSVSKDEKEASRLARIAFCRMLLNLNEFVHAD
mgnify:CR=1 FL=1